MTNSCKSLEEIIKTQSNDISKCSLCKYFEYCNGVALCKKEKELKNNEY